jgi:hypothetical protein
MPFFPERKRGPNQWGLSSGQGQAVGGGPTLDVLRDSFAGTPKTTRDQFLK